MSTPVQQLFDLSGRTALVTGGSRGLGLQIAEALGEAGARLVLTSRKSLDLEESAAYLSSRGIEAQWIAADASQPSEVARVCTEAVERVGPIDVLVNNAGASWGAPAEDYPLEAWDKVVNLNLRSVFLFSRHIAQSSMIPRGAGRILMIASICGLAGNGNGQQTVAYNSSKGGLIALTRALAAEWGGHGIRVNAIAPGYFPSKMTAGLLHEHSVDTFAARAPLRRLGDDDDLKGAALLLSSQAGKHITGQVLAVDGGVSSVLG